MAPESRRLEILNEVARIATLDLELRPMFQRVADALRRKFGWEYVACCSVDWERNRFVCEAVSSELPSDIYVGYTRGLGSGVVGEVALNGRAILLDDVELSGNYVETLPGARAELCVPVRHGGRTVAVINLESTRPGAFHNHLPLLATVAEQVAGAIANARLYDEVRRRARLLEMVSEVSKAALEAGELDLLLARIVEYVHRHFPLSTAAILLVDEARGEFQQAAQAGGPVTDAAPRRAWKLTEGVVGRAIRTGQPQLVMDVRTDPDYVQVDARVTSEYALPIRLGTRTLGVLDLEGTTPEAFSRDNQVVFRTFADQLAGAIHMAAMNQELELANARLRRANRRLSRLSARDGLTGVANRRRLDRALVMEWRRAGRTETPLSLLMADIDFFKDYNDLHGHQGGDEVLRRVAEALAGCLHRAGDLVARYGGEEFAILLPATDAEHSVIAGEKLRAAVEALRIPHGGSPVGPWVTLSLGAATARPRAGLRPRTLLERADRALYQAKREGRNRVRAMGEHPGGHPGAEA
ncbi:MAG TPA: diguanylate cyclase [Longimicrobium sp.]|nr:diguanylate cyclase [Longimicrobium sp.]